VFYRASGLACHLGFSGDCFATPIKVGLFSTSSGVIYRRFARSNKISARFFTPRPRVKSTRFRNTAAARASRYVFASSTFQSCANKLGHRHLGDGCVGVRYDRAAAFVHWNLAAPGDGESARRHRCACGGCYCGGRIRGHECADTGANWKGATVGTCAGIRTDGRRATISSSELAVRSSLKHGITIRHSQCCAAHVGLKSHSQPADWERNVLRLISTGVQT